MMLRRKRDVYERTPLRTFRFTNQPHVSLVRQPVSLSRIAGDTGTNNVLPCSEPSFIARQDMVKIQLASLENVAAILAGILVPLEHIVPSELHLFFWQPIEQK